MRTSRTALEIRWPRRPSSSSTPSSTPSTVISGLKASNLNCRCRSTGLHHCRAAVLAASGTDRLRELAVPRAPGALAKPDRIGPAVSGGAGSCDSGSRVASAQSMVASFIERMISNIDSQSAPSWPRRVCGGCSWPGSGQRRWHSWIRLRPAGSSYTWLCVIRVIVAHVSAECSPLPLLPKLEWFNEAGIPGQFSAGPCAPSR